LFDKLAVGDAVAVVWQGPPASQARALRAGQNYFYRIREIKIVDQYDLSILASSDTPILTLFTCHPLFSQEQRLVVIADLLET